MSMRQAFRASACAPFAALHLVMGMAACSTGPTTKTQLCSDFDELGTRISKANGVFDNGIFRQAGKLGSSAEAYEGADLARDAKRLKDISDSNSTSGLELMQASTGTASVCGHPLGTNALLGG